MVADESADKRTRERKEGAAKAVQKMHRDSFSAGRVDPGPKTNSSSFGVKAEPPSLPCRDDVVVENGAAAPKSYLSPLESRRGLTSHRQNFYNNKDHLQPVTAPTLLSR